MQTCSSEFFWTRIGSPTGKAISGSIEEIQEHRREGKPVMLYFSNAPVTPDSVDPAQYAQLTEFKKWAKGEGLFEFFESSADFRGKFSRQLPLTIRDNSYLKDILIHSSNRSIGATQLPPFGRVIFQPSTLSPDARALLATAAADQQGMIVVLRTMTGAIIQAGQQAFGEPQNQRSIAKWEAAIAELRERGLIRDADGSGKYFRVTDAGYRAIE
jgi:hypothetical protein